MGQGEYSGEEEVGEVVGKIRRDLVCHCGDLAEFGGTTAFEQKGAIQF